MRNSRYTTAGIFLLILGTVLCSINTILYTSILPMVWRNSIEGGFRGVSALISLCIVIVSLPAFLVTYKRSIVGPILIGTMTIAAAILARVGQVADMICPPLIILGIASVISALVHFRGNKLSLRDGNLTDRIS